VKSLVIREPRPTLNTNPFIHVVVKQVVEVFVERRITEYVVPGVYAEILRAGIVLTSKTSITKGLDLPALPANQDP
jgi:hypothetical protein